MQATTRQGFESELKPGATVQGREAQKRVPGTDNQAATYRKALKEAREQFRASTARRSTLQFQLIETEDEIARLRRTIAALSAMCSEHSLLDDVGITDAIKEVMAKERRLVSTNDVILRLVEIGFDIKSQKNVQASTHTVLQRLAKRELIERVEGEGKAVKWKGQKYDPDYDSVPVRSQ
jgi:hypothetical protein